MSIRLSIFVITTLSLINFNSSLRCISSACDTVRCANAGTCGPNEVKAKGGYCLCCDVCKKIVGEGVKCVQDTALQQLSDDVICRDGLACHGGVCKKFESVYGSQN